MTTVSQDASQLGRAIELVVADYREEGYPEATVEEALSSTLAELHLDDIANLSSGPDPVLSLEVAKAYREVLTADRADITRETGIKFAVKSAVEATAADSGDAVVEVEHPDAATAVAAAAAAVAQANGVAQDQPVIVVITEDVPDWVAEDPGF